MRNNFALSKLTFERLRGDDRTALWRHSGTAAAEFEFIATENLCIHSIGYFREHSPLSAPRLSLALQHSPAADCGLTIRRRDSRL